MRCAFNVTQLRTRVQTYQAHDAPYNRSGRYYVIYRIVSRCPNFIDSLCWAEHPHEREGFHPELD
jgi:hypothetical protein